jgi:hypothetical protein
LDPARRRPNLTIQANALTERLLIGGDGLVPEAVIAPCTKISKAAPNITSPPSRRTSHFSRLARPRR